MPNHHNAREIIQVIDVMYLKAQNLARDLQRKDLTEDEINYRISDLKDHARQVANG